MYKFVMDITKLIADILLICFAIMSVAACNKVTGKVVIPPDPNQDWVSAVQILLDGGRYRGYLRTDGVFNIYNVPAGSYVLEVVSPKYVFEPARIDITSKGSIRARRLNNLKPSQVSLMRYPLEMKPVAIAKYFQTREKFSIVDMLKSPMVLMMVLPLVMLVILPKMINTNDPELKKEMEQSLNMLNPNQSNMPDMSEYLSNLFNGGQSTKAVKSKESRQGNKNTRRR